MANEDKKLDKLLPMAIYWAKWMRITFLFAAAQVVGECLAEESILSFHPVAYMAGQIFNLLSTFMYNLLLLRFATREEDYRKAGIFGLGGMAMGIFIAFAPQMSPILSLIAVGSTVAFDLLAQYFECAAHAITVSPFDKKLSRRWALLWKGYASMFAVILLAPFLISIAPLVGGIVAMIGTVGILLAGFLKLMLIEYSRAAFVSYIARSK